MGKKKKPRPKSTLGKIWYFIWEDDSLLSWLVNIVLAFILIKFIVFPGLGLLFGTSFPVVAVVSGSMEHKTNSICLETDSNDKCINTAYHICGKKFDEKQKVDIDFYWETCGDFYTDFNISKEEFIEYRFKDGFNKGDIIILFGKEPKELKKGEVIVFSVADRADPIIHRIINVTETEGVSYFQTKGDNNPTTWTFERSINEKQIIGYGVFKIPYLGYIKIWFVDLLNLIGIRKYIPI